ncbi:Mitogen-activated protein kinase kinase 3 [Glycine soja]
MRFGQTVKITCLPNGCISLFNKLTEIRTLCEAPCYEGLVEFHGAFYTPDSGQISIALDRVHGWRIACRYLVNARRYATWPFIFWKGQSYLQSTSLALECGTGEFQYTANEGPVKLILQLIILFCPALLQLLSHPFITKYEDAKVDLARFVRSVFDPTQRMKDLADMLTIHHYLLFDSPDDLWQHTRNLYIESSIFSFSGKQHCGPSNIFTSLSSIRTTLVGDWPPEKLVHVVERLQ